MHLPFARILCIRKLSIISYLVWYPVLDSKKVCFGLYNPRENVLKVFYYRGISAGNPSLRTTDPKYSLNCCSSGITTPRIFMVSEIQKSVTVLPRKSHILGKPNSHFPPGNDVLNSFTFSEKRNPTAKGFLTERKADVSFAKRKVILRMLNTWNPLQKFSQPQTRLNTCSLNKKSQMMIQSLPYQ